MTSLIIDIQSMPLWFSIPLGIVYLAALAYFIYTLWHYRRKNNIILLLFTIASLASGQKAWAETITKTYLFSGGTASSNTTFQGYFYEEGKDAHYTCYPNPWTIETTGNIHATLADGITINIASSTNQIFVQSVSILGVAGDFTVTVGGGTNNYYIWHVELYNSPNQTSINEYNWGADVESTHTFSKTISAGYFYKLVVTYSTDDIYLINESSTTISGVDDEYPYTGSDITPEPEVVCNGRTLTNHTHYGVNYSNNNAPGTARVTVYGISPYHGFVTKNYTIYDPATVPLEWTAGSTVEVTENNTALNPISVTGTGNVTLRIANGVTLTAQYGITIADGATLTVEGPGSLIITNNTMGETGNDGTDSWGNLGGDGGDGGFGISGSLTVNGGTIRVIGGNGGTGGEGGGSFDFWGGNGGKGAEGGAGISGSLNVNGGTVNVTGGNGGNGGTGGSGFNRGSSGSPGSYGNALDCTVTCTAATHVIQESSNSSTWSNLASGSTSDKQYVRVIPLTPLTLYDNADNTTAIAAAAADGKPYTVTLADRTLYKDGSWNTLCLPFNLDAEQVLAQLAPAALMTLSTSSFANGELTLNFADATTIQAGTPYIIKWTKAAGYDQASVDSRDIKNPVFTGVTISNAASNVETTFADFCGTYDPITWNTETKSILFLGTNNTLYYPKAGAHLGAFRCYFELGNGLTAGEPNSAVRGFNLNFDEQGTQTTGIIGHTDITDNTDKADAAWYSLDGVKLDSKPTQKGLYLHGGRKVVIK